MPLSYTPSYQPSLEEEPSMVFDARQYKALRESNVEQSFLLPQDEELPYDDTHRLMTIDRERKIVRLREHVSPGEDSFSGQDARTQPSTPSPGHFQRGVPTNHNTSSKNYSPDHVRIIKGEHVSLMKNGALNEAMDDDDHRQHILEHRYLLSDPKLTETMRSSLLEHISMHSKLLKKGMKQVKEDTAKRAGRQFGPAVAERAALRHNGGSDSKIPQDSPFDAERKRSAGMVSMESGLSRSRATSQGRYQSALKIRRGL